MTIQTVVWMVTVAVTALPLLPLLYASFRDVPLYQPGGRFTAQGYSTLFHDPLFWTAVRNTVGFAAIATAIAVGGGSIFAILCTRTDLCGRRVFSLLILSPILLPPLGLVLGWQSVYGDFGFVTVLLKDAHLPVWSMSSVAGMGILAGCLTLPIAFLICRANLHGSDTSFEAAARSAGAGPLRVIATITLPALRPALVNSAILIAILAVENVGIPVIVGGYNRVDLYASYLYHTWSYSLDPDPTSVSAGAMLLIVVVSLLLLARNRALRGEQRFVGQGQNAIGGVLELGRWRRACALPIMAFLVAAVLIPILGLVISSNVTVFTPRIHFWTVGSLDNWRSLTANGQLSGAVIHSLLIAAFGGLIMTTVVAIATIVAHRSRFPLRQVEGMLLVLPRSIPGIATGLAIFWSFLLVNPPGGYLRNTIWGVAIALCLRAITLPYLVIAPALSRISDKLDAAARSVGASWWQTTRKIIFPQLRPALVAAFVLLFITLLNEYEAALFLVTPNSQIMGVSILQTYARGLTGPVAALALVQVGITALAIAVGAAAYRRTIHARH